MLKLKETKVKFLKGIGPKKEQLLNKLNIVTIMDLLEYFPRYYEDMTTISKISDLNEEKSIYKIKVVSDSTLRYIKGKMSILSMMVSDDSREAELIFFNQPFLKNLIKKGQTLIVSSILKQSGVRLQLTAPKILKSNDIGGMSPVYALTKGLGNKDMQKFIQTALELYSNEITEFLPTYLKEKYGLIDYDTAIKYIHFPQNADESKAARKRLAFDEILTLQLAILQLKGSDVVIESVKLENKEKELSEFEDSLPFKLTNAQKKVISEINGDLFESKKMNRLLQGDVGSGKTVVASMAIYSAFLNGYQSALMVPTEILAKQHYESISALFDGTGLKVGLLTGDLKPKEKQLVQWKIANNSYDLVIGTHALIQDKVVFNNLGLTITDEQHRFGVQQRKTLSTKGEMPNNLVMTATPIPRTLALVLYGDMDISTIDELPPNRKSIDTIVVDESYQERLDGFLLKQIEEGRQAYVVCPLIEEGESNLNSLEKVYKHYTSKKFDGLNVAYIHGKLKNDEKSDIMERFLNGDIDVLISTTVIEVGINVPNATLMIIFDADRFGLSQLHQLRGRVGRGSNKSYCVLINNNTSDTSYRRMKIMQNSNDGFYIAEKDLELRGQGELLGNRQHGVPEFKMINLVTDIDLIEKVKLESVDIYNKIREKNKDYEGLRERTKWLVEEIDLITN